MAFTNITQIKLGNNRVNNETSYGIFVSYTVTALSILLSVSLVLSLTVMITYSIINYKKETVEEEVLPTITQTDMSFDMIEHLDTEQ